ncbi:hypothetical protein [Pendulispora albinea]|uniref:Uncharacterized protein n=1 Tax=Pendulispora albinea TaxID=2741071 RepID=A0ABZ2M171_9BACT
MAASASAGASGIDGGHPRIFLSPDVLEGLRTRARGNASTWTALRSRCDEYAGGRVEYPDGADYPGRGSIGEGYQGQGYFGPLVELSLCYQIGRTLDAGAASGYARKGIEVLQKMTEKEGSHAPRPEHDSVYGIRFYGVGMAIAYDWLHSVMSPSERQKVYEAIDRWIDAYEKEGFGRDHPQGNYFAGYYAAKALGALATEGDNSRGAGHWREFLTKVHKGMVAPFYASHLAGGGWPEGWGYGTLAALNMAWPAWAARTAKGIDLIREGKPDYTYPIDQAKYLLHFAWPSRKTLDDRGTIHANGGGSAFDPMLAYATWGFANLWSDPIAPAFHAYAREVKEASGASQVEPWVAMLLWDESAPDAPFDTSPRSYVAKGSQAVAMRSSWGKDAVWASFTAGPYVNNPDSGEMLFDQGALSIVRGDRPLMVYAPTHLVRGLGGKNRETSEGTRIENQVYATLFGEKAERGLFNVYYAKPGHVTKYGQIANTSAKTAVGRFEDRDAFVVVRGDKLEEAYRPGTVASWTRQITFFRPALFVIDDRTEPADPHAASWLAFHLARPPVFRARQGSEEADSAGALFPLLPQGVKPTVVDVFGAGKVWRAEIRAPQSHPSRPSRERERRQRWLTAFDASASPPQATAVSLLGITEGKARGVLARGRSASYVLLAGPDESNRLEGAVAYSAPAPALHVLSDGPPGASYAVTVHGTTVRIVPDGGGGGTTVRASAQGIAAFRTSGDGKIEPVP